MNKKAVSTIILNFFKFLRSIKFGIILLIVILIFSIFSSLIPQGLDENFYKVNYNKLIFTIIFFLNLNNFFNSIHFFLLIILLFFNLSFCTIPPLITNLKNKIIKGSELIHLGILIIIIGGIVTFFTRIEESKMFSIGGKIDMGNNKILEIENIMDYSTEFILYENNKRKNSYTLKVNHPLSINGINIYQTYYTEKSVLLLESNGKIEYIIEKDEFITKNNKKYIYKAFSNEKNMVYLYEIKDNQIINLELSIGNYIDNYLIKEVNTLKMSSLKFVKDYGVIVVLPGMICIVIGLVLVYIKRISEE